MDQASWSVPFPQADSPLGAPGTKPSAFDAQLHRTCLHEAAHLVVARHFGATGFVRILRAGEITSAPSWLGRFQLYGDLADHEWRIVALAGAIAELIAGDTTRDVARVRDELARDPTLLTGADLELAQGYDERDVARCLALVTREWREIAAEANERVADTLRVSP